MIKIIKKICLIILVAILLAGASSAKPVCLSITSQKIDTILLGENSPEYVCDSRLMMRTMISIIEQLDEEMMWNYLVNLTSFGPRVTGTKGCDKAAEYIYDELKDLGLETRYHNWTDKALHGINVEGTLKGSDKNSDKIFIICGHYDGVPESVAADDNGAGTVSVLCAAKILSQYTFDHTIRFVLFSGEEQGVFGSYHYAIDAAKNNDNIQGVLNIDMTGYTSNIESGNQVVVYENYRSKWLSQITEELSKKYYKYIKLEPLVINLLVDTSDHFSFWQNGYDAIFYYEKETNPDYHTPEDDLEEVNITYATKIAKLAVVTLAEISSITNPITGKTLYVGGIGLGNYTSISDAVNNANIADTVYVYNGTYYEKLELRTSIDLIGENPLDTYIINDDKDPTITIIGDYIVLKDFTIKNIRNEWLAPALEIFSDHNVIITNNISDNLGYAIGLKKQSSFNFISSNRIHNNTGGIMLWSKSTYNKIHNNIITKNEVCGIGLSAESDYNNINGNIIKHNKFGIYTQAGIGEEMGNPEYTTISNNEITNNENGLYFNLLSKYNKIISNNISNNNLGIFLGLKCNRNRIMKNNFIKNNLDAAFENCFFNIWLNNHWYNRTVNTGPKIINGHITNLPWMPEIKWYNFDLIPSKKTHNIEL